MSTEAFEIKMEMVEILKIIEHELDFNEDEINHLQNDLIATKMKDILFRLVNIEKSFFFSKIDISSNFLSKILENPRKCDDFFGKYSIFSPKASQSYFNL